MTQSAGLTLCLFALLPIHAQQPRDFTGYWVAEFKGTPYLTLEIKPTTPPSGEITTGSVNADVDGNVSEVVEPARNPRKILAVRLDREGRLHFKTDTPDGEATEYEMKIAEAGRALLSIDGMPINPFPLSKKSRR